MAMPATRGPEAHCAQRISGERMGERGPRDQATWGPEAQGPMSYGPSNLGPRGEVGGGNGAQGQIIASKTSPAQEKKTQYGVIAVRW